MDTAGAFTWLQKYADRFVAGPFIGIGFSGSLPDQVFPGKITADLRIAISAAAHSADHGIRVYRNCSMAVGVVHGDWVAVREHSDIGIRTGSGQR